MSLKKMIIWIRIQEISAKKLEKPWYFDFGIVAAVILLDIGQLKMSIFKKTKS